MRSLKIVRLVRIAAAYSAPNVTTMNPCPTVLNTSPKRRRSVVPSALRRAK